jgi:hypothetical protein
MAKSFMTLGFIAAGAATVTLLIIGHPHPQAQENNRSSRTARGWSSSRWQATASKTI